MEQMKNLSEKLSRAITEGVPQVVAETAAEYFRQSFTRKGFDGKPWKPWANSYRHRTNGSLMIDTAALLNSIRPSLISPTKVVIQAGNSKVGYAKVHNEGFIGSVVVKSHTRRGRNGKPQSVRQHSRRMSIPQRQFMGNAKELDRLLKQDVEEYMKSVVR